MRGSSVSPSATHCCSSGPIKEGTRQGTIVVDALALALVPWSCFKSVVELALVSRSLGGPATQQAVGGSKKIADNPMDQDVGIRLKNLKRAPRCGARTRAGTACQRPAIRGRKRCRLHGGLSPGAPRGFKNGNYRNGNWTAEAIKERKWLRTLVETFAKNGITE